MVCLTSRILSGSRKRSSGFHDGSDISLTLQLPGSEGSSSEYSFVVRLLLIIVRAGLIAILVTQVENSDLPSKVPICKKPLIHES
jgi:hypothetical protein